MDQIKTKAAAAPLDQAGVNKLRLELKALEFGLDSLGGAARLSERMKIIAVRRKLKDADPALLA